MSMEDDLEAGLGVVSGECDLRGSFVVRFSQEAVGNLENLDDVVRLQIGMKTVKDKKKSKRPPKPPRPPKGPALDAYDLKLIKELSQLALERRMRIERIKDLKKKRASKASASSSNSSFISLIVTVLFCLVILFQGMCSGSGSVVKSQTSSVPVLSPGRKELLSFQVLKNLSPIDYDNGGIPEAQKSITPVLKEGPPRAAVL